MAMKKIQENLLDRLDVLSPLKHKRTKSSTISGAVLIADPVREDFSSKQFDASKCSFILIYF
jgi:hypothetical protein